MPVVTQPWTHDLPMMQQTVLLTAVRGPDNVAKYETVKYLLRWYRRCVLLSAMDGRVLADPHENNGGSFTGPSYYPNKYAPDEPWEKPLGDVLDGYLRSLDMLPHHFQMHFMHAAEIVGYKHPDERIRYWWHHCYVTLVKDLHLEPESCEQMDARLGDNRKGWLAANNPATCD